MIADFPGFLGRLLVLSHKLTTGSVTVPAQHNVSVGLGYLSPSLDDHRCVRFLFWRHAIPLFTVTYEPYTKGD